MQRLAAAPRLQMPPARALPQRRVSVLRRYWDFLAVILLVLGSFPMVWIRQQTVTLVPNYGLIDDHWQIDYTFKALRGIWIGRDVAFTHGPVFQWLSSIPARSLPLTIGALYATWNTIPLWCAIVFAYLALRLILPEQPCWKRFVLLLLVCTFFEASLRTTLPVLLFAVFLRLWYEVEGGRIRSAYAAIAGAILCAAAFLVAGDTGMYAVAAWVICFVAVALENAYESFAIKLALGLMWFLIASAAAAVVVNSFMGLPLDFRFWRDTLAQVSAYRWATPAAMTDQGTTRLVGGLLIAVAIFFVRTITRKPLSPFVTQRTGFLLGGFLFGLALMQSALVRSDLGHVIIGQFAIVFFTAALMFSFEGPASIVGVILAVVASMFFYHPVYRPSSLTRLYGQMHDPMTHCPGAYNEFDQACYQEPLTPQILSAGANFLRQSSGPDQYVFVYPYQTMFGLAAQRNVAGGLMQAYTASGLKLARIELNGLAGKVIPAALYLPDADISHWPQSEVQTWSRNYLSVPVDGILNFTRTPEVWFWTVRHYRMAQQLMPGVIGLLRDDTRSERLGIQVQSLGVLEKTYPIADRSSATDLGTPDWPQGFDFIRLRVNVRYPLWWKLRKPERLQLEITRADGSRDLQWAILPPNVSTDLWFYPWSAPDLAAYFNADSKQWRNGHRPAIVRLRLLATPLDWVSQQPESITIESAEAVKLVESSR